MFRGHCNKSINHCSIVQQGSPRPKGVLFLPGVSPGNVDEGEQIVEREGQSLLVPRLAVSESRELLGIAEDELVDVEDITSRERQVRREEHLSALRLLIGVLIVYDDDTDFTAQAYGPDVGGV